MKDATKVRIRTHALANYHRWNNRFQAKGKRWALCPEYYEGTLAAETPAHFVLAGCEPHGHTLAIPRDRIISIEIV